MSEEALKHALFRERELRKGWERTAHRIGAELKDSIIPRLAALETHTTSQPHTSDQVLAGIAAIRRDLTGEVELLRHELQEVAAGLEQLRSAWLKG